MGTDYTADARAYFTDGSNKKITVDKLNGSDLPSTVRKDGLADKLYTYTTDKDGNYELKQISDTADTISNSGLYSTKLSKNMAGYDTYNTTEYSYKAETSSSSKDTAYKNKRLNGTIIAEDAIVFVHANNEIKVISGKTARDWADSVKVANKGFLTDEANGIDYVKVAALTTSTDKVANADGDKLYAYLTDDSFETKKDGDTVTAFNVVVGNSTETTTLYEDGTSHTGIAAGSVIVYTVDGDEIDVKNVVSAADYTYNTSGAYAIKGFDGKTEGDITLVNKDGDIVSATLDKDCVFIGVDDAKNVGTTSNIGAVPTTADKDEYDRYDMNAYVVFNSDGDVVAIVYDTVNNELDIDNVKTASTSEAKALSVTANSVTATGTDTAATFSVETSPVAGNVKWGTTVTVTVTPTTAVAANNKAVVTVKAGTTTIGTLNFAAGSKVAQTVTFTMPNAATAVAATAVTSAVATPAP